jgi:RimJ/RimL family protein N-acetyltransferase
MQHDTNALGQPVGVPVQGWTPPPPPPRAAMQGQYCRLEPLEPDIHAEDLHAANRLDTDGRMWTYLSYGPFETVDSYRAWMNALCRGSEPLFFAIVALDAGKPVGVASYSRRDLAAGVIEVGHLAYSPLLQRSPVATEAMFLMMQNAFDLGYRRYEWRCNSLNARSRAAAQRLGFTYEGVFRQHNVHRGRNRDTTWLSVIDSEWPALKEAFVKWLAPENFDAEGRQKTRLSDLTRAALRAGL